MFQKEKAVVRGLYAAMKGAGPDTIAESLAAHTSPDWHWRGVHPFYERRGPADVARAFWTPLLTALTSAQRREDVFFAGRNTVGDGVWVVSMGHLMGLFDAPWLGIRPTRKIAMLRYCEFNRVADGKIIETMLHVDIPHLMAQAGQNPFPPQTAAQLVHAGPMTHDGLLLDEQPAEQGAATLALINAMIGDLGTWQSKLPLEEELARTWHDDMLWWGPTGIGATYTIERYAKQHSGPFRAAFYDRSGTGHVARLAEGHYGGFFGWPNFRAKQRGGFMGMPGNDKDCAFHVIDIYRRDGDKLAENWVFIDLLFWFMQQGDDVLSRMAGIAGTDYTSPDA
ncbi:ester cyclase [Ponticoccus sp. SC2-23]|uniref:nuclear transport factor 2 family protein n=1 Tax=Alexandriicola marinus TaxID=2081710 RepID=UPI000FDB85DB|nr:ester cyclase [Alexandriicola marinus]MBM1219756.1 ester cyclase [Ponticoccus sp. SC6-9]MBM1223172.1 ester cyclase [Ponticoccus sp. SC6-15]MBM1229569.1 ester cyclase [Ponticoccus sp. SC6-38]MBM1232138.1 ester cyclase [Ponticoccus sp. SC6-45]MBM1237912.1 ester cyclase [Ponticoccus sp. SC6-49]MBM1241149.1 ester cyclase [Ponticoccus sp. SC2-64]MBM1245662.1 ester cyclase [Ponticoccus sp. SC6-42]MBM1250140.1 ester cyclase [Ponticoccus sp. SC6-33]MBM1255921.1 ester cyclase [Ponticoccus sp. SC